MASYVAKVQFQNSLRRLSLGSDATTLSFSQLVARTRDLFQIPGGAKLSLTYVDRDGDVVTMMDDQDLQDALVMQALNPLRLTAAVVGDGAQVRAADPNVAVKNVPAAENVEKELNAEIQQKPTESVDDAVPSVVAPSVDDATPAGIAPSADDAKPVVAAPSAEMKSNAVGAAAVSGTEKEQQPQKQQEVLQKQNVEEPSPQNAGKVEADETAAAKSSEQNAPQAPAEGAAAASEEQQPVHYGIVCDGCNMRYIKGTRYKSLFRPNFDLCQACFDKPEVNGNEFAAFKRGRPPSAGVFMRGGFRGRNGCAGGSCAKMEKGTETEPSTAAAGGEAFHYGVVCDGCNTSPIVGPRFKSNRRFNYDLCQSCVQKVGGTTDEYTRVDQPAAQFLSHMFVGRPFRVFSPYAMFPFVPFGRPAACTRQIYVSVGDSRAEQNEAAAAKQEVKKEEAAEQKPAATPAPEKTQTEAQPESDKLEKSGKLENEVPVVPVTQEVVVANTEETNVSVQAEGSQSASELPANDGSISQKEDDVLPQQQAPEDISSFEGIMAKLAAMGFTDSQLNETLLRKNKFDLRLTLDDLCAAEEWDPMLEELQEMGFYDNDMNRRLLFEKNGNLKSVLKELVRLAKLGGGKSSKGEKQA